MKTKLFPSLLLLALLGLLPGCITTPEGNKTVDVARVSRLAGSAAYIGGVLYLSKHQDARPAFGLTIAALKTMEDSQNWDASAFASAMRLLPVRQFQGAEGAIYISIAVEVWDQTLTLVTPLLERELVKLTIPQVRTGLERALAETAL